MDKLDTKILDALDATYGKLVFTDAENVLERVGQTSANYHPPKNHMVAYAGSCVAAAAVICSLTLGALAHVGPNAYPGYADPLVLASEIPFAYMQHQDRLDSMAMINIMQKEVLQ
jgi:hypothetical protein